MGDFWVDAMKFLVGAGIIGLCILPFKAVRRLGQITTLVSALLFFLAFYMSIASRDEDAVRLGFANAHEREVAAEHGVTDTAAWPTQVGETARLKAETARTKIEDEAREKELREAELLRAKELREAELAEQERKKALAEEERLRDAALPPGLRAYNALLKGSGED
jgi:hypothetical protein